ETIGFDELVAELFLDGIHQWTGPGLGYRPFGLRRRCGCRRFSPRWRRWRLGDSSLRLFGSWCFRWLIFLFVCHFLGRRARLENRLLHKDVDSTTSLEACQRRFLSVT